MALVRNPTMKKAAPVGRDDFDGFTVTLAHDEDGDWLAYFVEQPQVSAFANSP
jgi:hypothetical protein